MCFDATANSAVDAFDGHVVDTDGVLLGNEGATVYLSGSTVMDPADEGGNHLCETTNSEGLAAIEVTNSSEVEVDVTTHFVNEGIERDKMFPFTGNAASIKEAEKKAKEAEEKKKAAEAKAAEEEKTATEKRAAEEAANTKHREEAAKAEKETAEKVLSDA